MMMVTLGRSFAARYGESAQKANEMFDRAEALQNTAKVIKAIHAVDADALEFLYSTVKTERRRRDREALAKRISEEFDKRFTHEEQMAMSTTDEMNERDKIEEELKAQDASSAT